MQLQLLRQDSLVVTQHRHHMRGPTPPSSFSTPTPSAGFVGGDYTPTSVAGGPDDNYVPPSSNPDSATPTPSAGFVGGDATPTPSIYSGFPGMNATPTPSAGFVGGDYTPTSVAGGPDDNYVPPSSNPDSATPTPSAGFVGGDATPTPSIYSGFPGMNATPTPSAGFVGGDYTPTSVAGGPDDNYVPPSSNPDSATPTPSAGFVGGGRFNGFRYFHNPTFNGCNSNSFSRICWWR